MKANPSPALLKTLWAAGITHYDVASIAEVRLVRRTLPDAKLCFMHPVKAEEAIQEAYFQHGVRTFSLDSLDELKFNVQYGFRQTYLASVGYFDTTGSRNVATHAASSSPGTPTARNAACHPTSPIGPPAG